MQNLSQEQKLQQRFKDDPAFFHREVLGYEPWEKQLEISLSIRDHRNTAIRSNNGSGKTYHIAREALRFLYAYGPDAVVINTAPTWTQIENQFWRYLRDAYQKALVPLGGKLLKTKLDINETWFAIGIANDETNMEGFQGWHAKAILVIFDEASGISPKIHEAALGAMAGGTIVRFVMLGNERYSLPDASRHRKSVARLVSTLADSLTFNYQPPRWKGRFTVWGFKGSSLRA